MLSLVLYFCLFLISNQGVQSQSQLSFLQNVDGISQTNQSCNELENIIQGCSDDCFGIKLCIDNRTFIVDCTAQSYGKNPYCNKTSNLCQSTPAKCGGVQQEFQCPLINGFYPDPFDCRKYYQCHFGIAYEGNCSQSVFNPKIPGCKKSVACYSFSPVNGLCRGKTGKIIVHPQDKNVYAFCDDYPIIMRCPADYIFNLKSLSCQYDCKVSGVFPDKDNYEWYYVCQKNGLQLESYHLKCPEGLYFNEFFGGCVRL